MVSSIEEFRRMKEESAKVERQGQKRAKTASLISLIGGAASAFGGKQSFQAGISGGQQLQQQVQEETDTQQQQMERDFMMKMQAQQFDQQFKMNDQKIKRDDMDFKWKMEEQKRVDERAAAAKDAAETKAEGATETKEYIKAKRPGDVSAEIEEPKHTPEQIEQIGMIAESLSRGEVTPQAASIELARIGAELPKPESQKMAEQAQAQKDSMQMQKDFLDLTKKTMEVQGMELDAQAEGAFYGVLDGVVNINTLPRPLKAKVRGMLEDYMVKMREDEMSMAKDKASIASSYASAGASNALTDSRKLEQMKTIREIQKMDQEPQQQLTFDEIKGMAMNVREEYYYDPIRKLAAVSDNDGITSKLREMKDEGMAPEDMIKFLSTFSTDQQRKTYAEFASEVRSKSGLSSKPSEKEVKKHIEERGWKQTEAGDYAFQTTFSKRMKDPDWVEALLNTVYTSNAQPLSSEQYTGEMWEPMR